MPRYTLHPTYLQRDDGARIPIAQGNADYAEYLAWVEAGGTAAQPPAPDLQARVAGLLSAVDHRLNSAARAKGYDSIINAALRAGYPGPFHDEGVAFATWMDETYATCYRLLAQVQGGEIDEPDEEALLALLPPPPSFD